MQWNIFPCVIYCKIIAQLSANTKYYEIPDCPMPPIDLEKEKKTPFSAGVQNILIAAFSARHKKSSKKAAS